MATNTKKRPTTKKATPKKTTTKAATQPETDSVTEPDKAAPIIPKEIDLSMLIPVYNGYQGMLIYKSNRTGEKIEWGSFGEEQPMELRELRMAKSSAANKAFFIKNWFMFDDEYQWVIDYLGVRNYYKNSVALDEFDDVFDKSPTEVAAIIASMPKGQVKSLQYRAHQLIESGDIDSRKMISALEAAFGVELVEK